MKARVNTGLILRTVMRLVKAGVSVECKWSWRTRGGGAPRDIIISGKTYLIGGDTLRELTNNGYRLVNISVTETGTFINFERDYA